MAVSPSDSLVIFGATGDLAYKKIFPALQAMVRRNLLILRILSPFFRPSHQHGRDVDHLDALKQFAGGRLVFAERGNSGHLVSPYGADAGVDRSRAIRPTVSSNRTTRTDLTIIQLQQ